MKQRFSVMKMTLTYRAGARDPLGLKNQIESLCSFWFKGVVIWVWSSDLVSIAITSCLLPIAHYQLPIANYKLPIAND